MFDFSAHTLHSQWMLFCAVVSWNIKLQFICHLFYFCSAGREWKNLFYITAPRLHSITEEIQKNNKEKQDGGESWCRGNGGTGLNGVFLLDCSAQILIEPKWGPFFQVTFFLSCALFLLINLLYILTAVSSPSFPLYSSSNLHSAPPEAAIHSCFFIFRNGQTTHGYTQNMACQVVIKLITSPCIKAGQPSMRNRVFLPGGEKKTGKSQTCS